MSRFRDVSNFSSNQLSPSSEVAQLHQCMYIFGLSVQGDNLGSYSQQRRNFIVSAIDLCSHWIYSQPTSFCVVNDEIFVSLHGFFIGETRALIGC